MVKTLHFQCRGYGFDPWLGRFCRFPWWFRQQRICLQGRGPGFNPWVGRIPWRRKWQSTPIFLPEKFHGQRSLAGYSPKGWRESDMTKHVPGTHCPPSGKVNSLSIQYPLLGYCNFCHPLHPSQAPASHTELGLPSRHVLLKQWINLFRKAGRKAYRKEGRQGDRKRRILKH